MTQSIPIIQAYICKGATTTMRGSKSYPQCCDVTVGSCTNFPEYPPTTGTVIHPPGTTKMQGLRTADFIIKTTNKKISGQPPAWTPLPYPTPPPTPTLKTASAHWPVLWEGAPGEGLPYTTTVSRYSLYTPPCPTLTTHSALRPSPQARHSPVLTPAPQWGETVQRKGRVPHTHKGKTKRWGMTLPMPHTAGVWPHPKRKRNTSTRAGTAPSVAVQGPLWPGYLFSYLSWGTGRTGERRHTHNYFTKDWAELTTRAPPPHACCPA